MLVQYFGASDIPSCTAVISVISVNIQVQCGCFSMVLFIFELISSIKGQPRHLRPSGPCIILVALVWVCTVHSSDCSQCLHGSVYGDYLQQKAFHHSCWPCHHFWWSLLNVHIPAEVDWWQYALMRNSLYYCNWLTVSVWIIRWCFPWSGHSKCWLTLPSHYDTASSWFWWYTSVAAYCWALSLAACQMESFRFTCFQFWLEPSGRMFTFPVQYPRSR